LYPTTSLRFSAFIITETGRTMKNGKPMLDYRLTRSTGQFPLDAVVYRNEPVGASEAIATLCHNLGAQSIEMKEDIQATLVKIIKTEASAWRMEEDLSRRQHLLEGSEAFLQQEPDTEYSLYFTKPPKPSA
jgi:hypothetical protein